VRGKDGAPILGAGLGTAGSSTSLRFGRNDNLKSRNGSLKTRRRSFWLRPFRCCSRIFALSFSLAIPDKSSAFVCGWIYLGCEVWGLTGNRPTGDGQAIDDSR
jgi:hypothetical protein